MVAPGIHFGHTFTAVEILAEQHFGVVAVEQICDLARMEFGGSSFLPSGIIVAEIIKIVVVVAEETGSLPQTDNNTLIGATGTYRAGNIIVSNGFRACGDV